MRSRHVVLIAALLGIALIVAGAMVLRGVLPGSMFTGASEISGQQAEESRAPGETEGIVRLSENQIRQFGIESSKSGPGRLRMEVVLPGEVTLNADRIAHVVPRVSGVVHEVRKNLGDSVRGGEIMAVLESRDLADSTAALLAARERVSLAQSNLAREEQLWQKRISPEQDYIQAKNALAAAGIELRNAEQKLRALGFSEGFIAALADRPGASGILYETTAPFGGTIIEKHISLGEVVKDDSPAFVIADLSTVWVNLDVHQKDLPLIRIGQTASIGAGSAPQSVQGRISFLEPIAEETNRTVHARVVIPNSSGSWRPGLFVTGRILVEDVHVPVLVPNDALIMVGGKICLFLKEGDVFRLQPVAAGRTNGALTEITGGLEAGRSYVIKGAFTLKSELGKPEAEK